MKILGNPLLCGIMIHENNVNHSIVTTLSHNKTHFVSSPLILPITAWTRVLPLGQVDCAPVKPLKKAEAVTVVTFPRLARGHRRWGGTAVRRVMNVSDDPSKTVSFVSFTFT